MRQYNLIKFTGRLPLQQAVQMAGHDDAWLLGQMLLNSTTEASEVTYTEFPNGRLVIRVLNAERMFAKVETTDRQPVYSAKANCPL